MSAGLRLRRQPGEDEEGEQERAESIVRSSPSCSPSLGRRRKRRPIIKGEEDRPHRRVAGDSERLKLAVNGKTVEYAAKLLTKLHYEVKPPTLAGVREAGKNYLRDQFNSEENLWAGPSEENQRFGREFAVAKKHADRAMETGDKIEFEKHIATCEALWHDPDPGGKQGFKHMVKMTVQHMRMEFKKRHG